MQSFYRSLPFAYETKVDTVAHMSCVNRSPQSEEQLRNLFTFYVGAHRPGTGVRLSPDYLEKTKYLRVDELLDSLRSSPINSQAQPQLWIRPTANLQGAFIPDIGSPAEGMDYDNMTFNTLDSWEIAPQLVQSPGSFLRFFESNSISGSRRFEGRLRLMGDGDEARENMIIGLSGESINRNGQREDSYLSLSFLRGPQGSTGVWAPESGNPERQIFGQGFALNLAPAPGSTNAVLNRRVLSQVREHNLELPSGSQAVPRTWTCPENLRFMILRPEDVGSQNALCTEEDNENNIDPRIIQILDLNYWAVSPSGRCIYPRVNSEGRVPPQCYASEIQTVNYSGSPCDPKGRENACPHYFSICYAL